MKRTNRIEPLHIGNDALRPALMTITTQLDIIRRVEVVPINKTSDRIPSDLNQSRIEHARLSPQMRTKSAKQSRRTLGCIACLFLAAGIVALAIVISGIILALGNFLKETNSAQENDIEKYELGDLHYGINHESRVDLPSNTYLSSINKETVQKYLSDQLLNEPGFRGVVIDGVFVQNLPTTNQRKQRETSCRVIFIIHNLQVYFDQCSTCINNRNLLLRRSFFNRTALRQPLYLVVKDRHLFAYICSIPTLSFLISPARLNVFFTQTTNDNPLQPLKTSTAVARSEPLDTRIVTTTFLNTRSTNPIESTSDILSLPSTDSQTSNHHIGETSQSPIEIHPSTKPPNLDHRQSSRTKTQTPIQRTPPSMFQFLPFKPSASVLTWRNTSSQRRLSRHLDHIQVSDDVKHRRSSLHRT